MAKGGHADEEQPPEGALGLRVAAPHAVGSRLEAGATTGAACASDGAARASGEWRLAGRGLRLAAPVRAAAAALCLARLAPALCLAKLGVVAAAPCRAPALPRAPRLQVLPLLPSLVTEIERRLRLVVNAKPVLALLGGFGLSLPRARDRAKGLGRHGRNAAGSGDSRRRRLLAVGGRSLVDDALAQPADFGLDAVHVARSGAAAGRRGPALPPLRRRGQARVAGGVLQSAIGAHGWRMWCAPRLDSTSATAGMMPQVLQVGGLGLVMLAVLPSSQQKWSQPVGLYEPRKSTLILGLRFCKPNL